MTTSNSQSSGSAAPSLDKVKDYFVRVLSSAHHIKKVPVEQRRQAARHLLAQAVEKAKLQLPSEIIEKAADLAFDETYGLGVIQPLLEDIHISEVMVNGVDKVYIEKDGKIVRTNIRFPSEEHIIHLIQRIVQPLGRVIDADHPAVDARLPDGSRVHAIIPPVAIDGPTITIRKFTQNKLSIEQLVQFGSLTAAVAEFLRACVKARLNIIISGGTGSGKTTLLNILSGFIPEDERIITIEDAAELQLRQEHVVRLETKAPSADGSGSMTIRDLVRNSLRMRPDRIVVGEVRGGEALDMLQAMNTGHDGSLTTLHANSPRDVISRLETMTLMAGIDLPIRVVREQIASAVDLIVQQSRLRDGSRRVTQVTEVAGMEGDTIVLTDIFKFEQTGISPDGTVLGEIKPTGIRPMFSSRLEAAGFKLSPEVFGVNIAEMLAANRQSPSRRR